jgi:hypothetical protein
MPPELPIYSSKINSTKLHLTLEINTFSVDGELMFSSSGLCGRPRYNTHTLIPQLARLALIIKRQIEPKTSFLPTKKYPTSVGFEPVIASNESNVLTLAPI